MEITIAQRIIGILLFSWYLFSPEILKIQEGKFSKTITIKTIVITFLSIFITTRLDIKYFIANYPQRAIVILVAIIAILFAYFKYVDLPKKFRDKIKQINKIHSKKEFKKIGEIIFKKNIKNIKLIIVSYFNKILRWIYYSNSSEILIAIEKQAFLFVWNSLRIIILYILLFDHLIIIFLDPSFGFKFLLLSMLFSVLFMNRIIQKYPIRIFLGAILAPWIVYFPIYFISKDIGVRPPFLEDDYLVSYLGLDTSDWLMSTIKFSTFSSTTFVCTLILWTVLSLTASYLIKQIIVFSRLVLIQLPVFRKLKKNYEKNLILSSKVIFVSEIKLIIFDY
jgi:hypothetical protein